MAKNFPGCETEILDKRAPDFDDFQSARRILKEDLGIGMANIGQKTLYLQLLTFLGFWYCLQRCSVFSVCQKPTLHSHNCCQLIILTYSRKGAHNLLRSVVPADLGHSRPRKKEVCRVLQNFVNL